MKKRSCLYVSILILFVLAMSANAFASISSSISLSSPGPFKVNDTFTVYVRITEAQNVFALEGNINFPNDKLNYISSGDANITGNINGILSFNTDSLSKINNSPMKSCNRFNSIFILPQFV